MSINAPRYTIGSIAREPRWNRVRVIVFEGLMRRLAALNIVLIVLGSLIVGVEVVIFTTPAFVEILNAGGSVGLSNFATPYRSVAYLLLATLLVASAGAGAIAGDVANRSIALYLSRPITPLDYLIGKGTAVGLVLAIFFIVPGVGACLFAYIVGNVSIGLAALAMGAFIAVGLLVAVVFTSLSLFMSSLTRRPIFAGASIFGVLVSAEVLAALVQGVTRSNQSLYVSPIEDLLAVGQATFGVTPTINASAALVIVLVLTAVSLLVAYLRVRQVEVVG
ncbi:MAG: ABC transporter permease subunit [Thermoplasmata archaeon]|jgi:ABC-type transport system involved in multi-copper enzyme maturation permease subunit|nr:ABC transporter permease subunit [Thermoplasmata archaeon]